MTRLALQSSTRIEPWMPSPKILWALQQEERARLERDYRFLHCQLFGRRPVGDWLDRLVWEITRWAAPAFVAKGTQTFGDGTTTLTVPYSGATAGNWLHCAVAVSRFTSTNATIATPTGWTPVVGNASNGPMNNFTIVAAQYIKENIASGSHSAAFTGFPTTTFSAGIISEYSGIVTSSSIDQSTSNNGGTATATSGNTGTTGSTTQNDELCIACGHAEEGVGNVANFTNPSSGYTNIAVTATNSVHIAWSAGYKILSSTGTQTGSFTWTTSSIWAGSILTALGVGGGGGTFGRLVGGTLMGGLLTGGLLVS